MMWINQDRRMWVLIAVMTGFGGVAQAASEVPAGLAKAFAIIEKSPIGNQLLQQAQKNKISIQEGKLSKTEIVATRTIEGRREKLEFHVQILISKDKNPVFQAIDLAHELVHAIHPKSNPFDPKLNAVDYVRQGIESDGGEAHAIQQECKVGQQLLTLVQDEQAQLIKARCQFVWNTEKNNDQWVQSFYHLGRYQKHFSEKLNLVNADVEKNEELNSILESKDPMFTSAAANKPYPLALLDEYVEITRKICKRSSNPLEERCQSLSSALFSR